MCTSLCLYESGNVLGLILPEKNPTNVSVSLHLFGVLFDCIHQNVNLILVLGWPESDLAPFSSVVKNGVVRVVEPYKGSLSPFVCLVAFLPLYSLGILVT